MELFQQIRLQDCIGVAYTATQSILELFKLEVDYSSTFISAKVQDCIGVLIQQLNTGTI